MSIQAENGAIDYYNRIIEFCEGFDYVTQDMFIDILRDEEAIADSSKAPFGSMKQKGLSSVPRDAAIGVVLRSRQPAR